MLSCIERKSKMPREGTVTIRLDWKTKRWLEAFQSNYWKRTGKRLNNDEAIAIMIEQIDPAAVTEGTDIYEKHDRNDPKKQAKRGSKE
jgi:hypothetical protein